MNEELVNRAAELRHKVLESIRNGVPDVEWNPMHIELLDCIGKMDPGDLIGYYRKFNAIEHHTD